MARGDTRSADPSGVPALAGCAPATLAALSEIAPTALRPRARAWEADRPAPLLILLKGALAIERAPIVIDVARAPAVCCDVGFLDGGAATSDAVALRASIAIVVSREAARRLRDPALDAAAEQAVLAGYRARATRIEAMVRGEVDRRLLGVVADLAERFGTAVGGGWFVALPLRRRDLAAMVGAKPETASRVLARLEKDGVLRSRREGLWVAANVLRPAPDKPR